MSLNCTEAQVPAITSGTLYCKDSPWRCAALYPEYGAAANWTINTVTKKCLLVVSTTTQPVQNNTNTSSVSGNTITCPTNYVPLCGVSCVCVASDGNSGTIIPGSNATASPIPYVTNRQSSSSSLICSNTIECFFVDRLPYALTILGIILVLLLLCVCCCKRCCCPKSPWCCKCCYKICSKHSHVNSKSTADNVNNSILYSCCCINKSNNIEDIEYYTRKPNNFAVPAHQLSSTVGARKPEATWLKSMQYESYDRMISVYEQLNY